jgi:hypothetical protein
MYGFMQDGNALMLIVKINNKKPTKNKKQTNKQTRTKYKT